MKLYIDNINSALRGDPESTTEPSLVLFSEDSLPLEIFFFEKTTDEPAVFVDPNPEQISVGVGYQGQLLAFSNSFTKTGSGSSAKWTGTLNLNTQQAAFATKDLLDGTSLSVVLEVEAKTGSQKLTKAQILASLNKDLINETDNLTDVGNVTSVAESHINATTNVHGIANTANLVFTNDARLSDARTPTAHKSSHATGGSDAITPADIGAQPAGSYAAASHTHADATTSVAGFLSTTDKTKLDRISASGEGVRINVTKGSDITDTDPDSLTQGQTFTGGASGLIEAKGSAAVDGYSNTNRSGENGKPGGSLLLNAGRSSELVGSAGGVINLSGGDNGGGDGGQILMTGGAGSNVEGQYPAGNGGLINLSGGSTNYTNSGGNGGLILMSGGNAIEENGGNAGTLNLSGGDGARGTNLIINDGGSIDLSNGGGSINLRGTGSIQFGIEAKRTTVTGTATENRFISLPNASGTLSLEGHTHAVEGVTGLQEALNGKQDSGNYASATHTHAISDVTNLQTELNNKQASGTYATLVGGKIPSDQLPSYVDDVLEFANNEAFPATGEIGIIYVSLATNKTFRWSGSAYVEISPSEVTSVNTKTGAVTLTASDVGAAPSTGISPSAITGTAVVTTDSRLSDARTPTAHTHAISDVTNLQTTLDDKASSSHTHSVNGGTAVGSGALLSNSIGINNTAVGASALQSNTTGGQNTAVGQGALFSNIEGQNNTAVGFLALQNSNAGHLYGGNTAVGVIALKATTTGIGNTAVGHQALAANTTGSNNTAVGVSALLNNAAENNSAFGYQALAANTSGTANTAVGYRALAVNTTSGNNTAIGLNALQLCTGGSNTAVGRGSLGSANSGNHNVGIGSSAGGVLTTGSENVIIGSGANVDAVNRSRCVVLGYATTSPAVNGSLAIGGSGAAAMGGLVTTAAPTGATGNYLRIWLNGTEYRIPIQLAN